MLKETRGVAAAASHHGQALGVPVFGFAKTGMTHDGLGAGPYASTASGSSTKPFQLDMYFTNAGPRPSFSR